MTASEYCPGHPGDPAPAGDSTDLRRVECDRCFLDYVHETVGTEGVPTRDDLARLFSLAAKAVRRQADNDALAAILRDRDKFIASLDERLSAAEAEVERLRTGIDDLRSQHAAAFERLRVELSGRVAEVDSLRTRNDELEAAIACVRALTEDEWGPLSDDVERCALCRRKWSKHGDDVADHSAASSALVAHVVALRAALDGGDDDD